MIITMKNSQMHLVIPDGYTRLKAIRGIKSPNDKNTPYAYQKITSNANCIFMLFHVKAEEAMNFDDTEGLINGIHAHLADNQGIIVADSGETKRGYKYIYSIVKTIGNDADTSSGARYFLRMNLEYHNEILEIQGDFTEMGTTGVRDSMGLEFARRANLVDISPDENELRGWTSDPYDSNYKKGICMNLSERVGLDNLFPDHPLSQARELVHALINDELMGPIEKSSNDGNEETENKSEAENQEHEIETLRRLFLIKTRRFTPINVEVGENGEDLTNEHEKKLDIKKVFDGGVSLAKDGLNLAKKGVDSTSGLIKKCVSETGKGVKKAAEKMQDAGDERHQKAVERKLAKEEKKDQKTTEPKENEVAKEKKQSLDDALRESVDQYNAEYTRLNDYGTTLFTDRQRAVDLLIHVEGLVNSIANHPKSFDTDIEDIQVNRKTFKDVCDFAKSELEAAQKSAVSAGAGVAGGMAVASIAPTAAMWIATTFGTASTGTAISALSGAAATNAALAWLGGGALAAGGGGMAAGNALLAMAGPVGWSIAGATLLTSVVLFANKKVKLNKEKKEEIESVLNNTQALRKTCADLREIVEKTISLRDGLNGQYETCIQYFGKDFRNLAEDDQLNLGALVNNAKSLSATLNLSVEA